MKFSLSLSVMPVQRLAGHLCNLLANNSNSGRIHQVNSRLQMYAAHLEVAVIPKLLWCQLLELDIAMELGSHSIDSIQMA